MGSSISKVFKRKGQKAEFPVNGYEYHTQVKSDGTEVSTAIVQHRQTVLEDSDDGFEDDIQHVQRIYVHDGESEHEVYQNNVYYDDEDMIRFVSALSLAEFNQSALPELDQSTSKQEPKKSRRIPDALEEFFVSLDAQATSTAGPSTYQTATYGKTPIAKNLISKPVVAEEGVLIDLSPTQECAICVEEKRLTDFPLVTEACQHPPQTCLICVQNWLTRELDNTDWDKIHCVACKEVVLYDNMKRILTPATFEKYDQYSRNSLLSTLPEFRWCISPTCKSGQIHENGVDGPIFFCTACFSKACVIHNVVWHEGETCNEYDYRKDPSKKLEEEKASRIEIKESSKPCPGPNCKVNITRNGGCDHMKCTRCKYEFCWLCLADYDKIRKNGNSSHKKSCKLHTDNLPD